MMREEKDDRGPQLANRRAHAPSRSIENLRGAISESSDIVGCWRRRLLATPFCQAVQRWSQTGAL